MRRFPQLRHALHVGLWLPPLLHACAGTTSVTAEARPPQQPAPAWGPAPAAPAAPQASPAPLPAWKALERPILTPHFLRLRAEAQARILGRGNEVQDATGVVRNPLGSFVNIENDDALGGFRRDLAELAAQDPPQRKLRILAYGASHTQGDYYTGYLRYYLQSRFGNGGQGFVQLAQFNKWYRQLDTKIESKGFRTQHAQRNSPPGHGRFGLMGVAAVGRFPYAFGRVQPQRPEDLSSIASQYELYYGGEPDGGGLIIKLDGAKLIELQTRSPVPEPRYHAFTTPRGWHTIEVKPKGNGAVRVYGATIERDQGGIVIDTLGINGTRAANMLKWDEALWAAHVQRRRPSLIMLAYGTNETVDVKKPIEAYEAKLRSVLKRLQRAAPGASCLLVGPGDFPKRSKSGWFPRSRLTDIIDVQRKLAFEEGCGFWDTYAFMGGEGSMQRWAEATPAMATQDHIHLTARGYVKMGMVLGDALLLRHDAAWRQHALGRLE